MRSVAAYKWERQLAIEDEARETLVLEKARLSALKPGIAPDTAEAFFISQIDAAKDIQRYWFGQWEWPTLSEDLVAGEYDIAMNSVSVTAARKQLGNFSHPYHVGGKTPITRCEDKDLFGSLAAIDRESVTLVVNPGGTNQQFLDAHVHRAKIIVHQDNRDIFELILNHNGDVMITDRIEVQLQTALHPELASSMTDNLSYQEKAYLIPGDAALTNAVNQWLESAKTQGTLDKAFENAIPHE